MLFELVMDEAFDPWEIDLARFTEAYLERVRSEGGVDFAVAGRLLYMAWSILYLQSKELLQNRALPAADPAGRPRGRAGRVRRRVLRLPRDAPEAVDVTTAVLGGTDDPALVQMVRHPETRPVSLLELVHAFGDAEEEARTALRIQELRERLREEQKASPEVLVHGDIPERDLADAWEIACGTTRNEPFPILELWRADRGPRPARVGVPRPPVPRPGTGRSTSTRPDWPRLRSSWSGSPTCVRRWALGRSDDARQGRRARAAHGGACCSRAESRVSVKELTDALGRGRLPPGPGRAQAAHPGVRRPADGARGPARRRPVRPPIAPGVRRRGPAVTPVEMAPRTLKALTLIAYHQPILQSLLVEDARRSGVRGGRTPPGTRPASGPSRRAPPSNSGRRRRSPSTSGSRRRSRTEIRRFLETKLGDHARRASRRPSAAERARARRAAHDIARPTLPRRPGPAYRTRQNAPHRGIDRLRRAQGSAVRAGERRWRGSWARPMGRRRRRTLRTGGGGGMGPGTSRRRGGPAGPHVRGGRGPVRPARGLVRAGRGDPWRRTRSSQTMRATRAARGGSRAPRRRR